MSAKIIEKMCKHCGVKSELIPFGADKKGYYYGMTNDYPQQRWTRTEDGWYCHKCRNKK